MLRVGIGLDDILALNVDALEGAFAGGVQHVGDAQARLALQRDMPGFFEQLRAPRRPKHAGIPENSCGNDPMSQEPCTLFWPRSGFTPTPRLPMLPVSHGEIRHAHHHGRALAVLGDAESVIDGRVAAGRIEASRGAQIGGRNAADGFRGFGRIALFGDELAPLLEGLHIAALFDERLVQQTFGDDHVRHRVDHGDVGAGLQRQMIIGLDVRRSSPDRCGADRPRSAARPRAAAASCAKRTPDARRSDWRRSP